MGPEIEESDVQALLLPISGELSGGDDPRGDFSAQSLYYRLRDARAEARAAERAADTDADAATPSQWRLIAGLAGELLAAHSKDLEVAAWFTEAKLRLGGLAGLATGNRLMTGLVETYWDGLFPLPDEDGIATRLAPVVGLNGLESDGTLIQPLRKIVLFHRPDGTPFPLWQYLQSAELVAMGDAARRAQRIQAGAVPFETAEAEARAADPAQWVALRDNVAAAMTAWAALGTALDAKAGAASPSTGRVRDLLAEIGVIVERYAPPSAQTLAAVTPDASPEPADGGGEPSPPLSRERALAQLDEIAEFFRRNEPHSPLSYTLGEAVRRGRMSLPELLQEVVPDAGVRRAILTTLGIRPQE